jgi:hypothetical protein
MREGNDMTDDYTAVSKALESGADPSMICQTCPWDRNCVNPPTMTRAEVDAKCAPPTDGRSINDQELMKGLVSVALFAGKDTAAQVCPVFALCLRSSEGRRIVDLLKERMAAVWDDAT